jgi:hypothetical protein
MHVTLDETVVEVPRPASLAELLEGIEPHVDPARTITGLEVDGCPVDATDATALGAWRLAGDERVAVTTQTPGDFVAMQRAQIPGHLDRIATQLTAVATELDAGDTGKANHLLATGTRELVLVLELDQSLSVLSATAASCAEVVTVLERIGTRLTDAEKGGRWPEVASLLRDELVPAIRRSC